MNKIYILADIHGDYKPIKNLYFFLKNFYHEKPLFNEDNYPDGSDWIILLGDFGANYFFNKRDNDFKKKLNAYPFNYFIIRGNHEERPSNCAKQWPEQWKTRHMFEGDVWIEKEYPYIVYAMDYPTAYKFHNHLTFVFPGAYSVDKYYRLANKWSWFKDEQLTSTEMAIGKEMIEQHENKCDLVLSHTCPSSYEPTDLFLSCVDQSMVDKTMERYLNEIEYKLDYKLWAWGHYHQTRIYPITEDKKDHVMLFNDTVIDLDKYFETKNPYDALIKFAGSGS